LHNIVQGDTVSLQQYMARLATTSLHILDLHLAVAMHTLLVGFHLQKFLDMLYIDPPTNMNELNNRVAQYISDGLRGYARAGSKRATLTNLQ